MQGKTHLTDILQNHKSVDGISLQDHLQSVIQKYINNNQNQEGGVQHFEQISNFLKRNQFIYKDPKSDKEVNNIPVEHGELYNWVQDCQLLQKENRLLQKQKRLEIQFPNFINDSQMLEQVGVSFGESETVRIYQSLRKLQNQTNATQLRFWGKILTRGQDYYVAEGVISSKNADQVPKGTEPIGFGSNTYTYWVTHNVLDEWFELPFVQPEHIVASKGIKYIMTGDLNACVNTHPIFPGQEKHFLRAQIARISHATVLTPNNLYGMSDAEEEKDKVLQFAATDEDPAFKLPEYAELKTLENWVHLYPALVNAGRTYHYVDPSLDEEVRNEILEKLGEEEIPERLKAVAEEKSPYPPGKNADGEDEEEGLNWQVREFGDLQVFDPLKDDGVAQCYGTIQIKNLTWPGAQLVCNAKGWTNIYVGYGLKTNQSPLNPIQPLDLLKEQADTEEYPEPNPKNPVQEVEADSDKEGKEGEEGEEDDA